MISDAFSQMPVKNTFSFFLWSFSQQHLMTSSPPLVFVLVDHSFELSAYKDNGVSLGGLSLASNT